MKLSEPTTAITDYMLAVELLLLGSLLAGSSTQASVRLWAASFFVMGVAATAGGIFHAGRFSFGASLLQHLWNSVRIGIALSFGLLLVAGAMSTSGVRQSILFAASVLAALVIRRGSSSPSDQARRMTIKGVAILLVLAPALVTIQLLHNGVTAGIWILIGGLIAGGAIAMRRARITIHHKFNHNDLFHVVMMAAYYVLYRGGLLLRDR